MAHRVLPEPTSSGKRAGLLFFLTAGVFLCLYALLGSSGPASAQGGRYFVNGQSVAPELYQAVSIVNEGLSLLHDNRNEEAIAKFARAVELAPDLPEAHHNLALALAKVGRTNEAIEHLQKAVAINPDLSPAVLTLGGLYQSTGEIDLAIKTYREFLKRFPKDSEAPKIANLIKGLESVSKNMGASAASSHGAAGNASADDYVTDMTRNGVFRWPDKRMPIRVYVHPGEGVPGYRPGFQSLLANAFEDWSAASGKRVRFSFVSSAKNSDIQCMWLNDPTQLSNAAESGETRVFTDTDGILRGTVKLLTVPLSAELPLTDNHMRQICLHEIGHVLGLAGHTTNPADAMFFSSSVADQWRTLSARDSNTITRLYSMKFAVR